MVWLTPTKLIMLNEDADFAVVGRGTPDFELGWTNQLTFGEWSVNAFFRGAFGHSLVNTFRVFYEPRVGSQKSYNYVNTELAKPRNYQSTTLLHYMLRKQISLN